ncbi:MAG TPA: ADP-heptose--LPS heptosyltransferase [Verrucomicrobiae bacterium]|nr:ADP-heptose--LPS heptosyltransferase [Verrucomicrobiae bacterium]
MKKLILENHLSPGDIVMLTAAMRDLHLSHRGCFLTDVRTSSPELWEHNPYLTPLDASAPDVKSIVCHYPSIHRCHQSPDHFLMGFMEYLNEQLDLRIRPTAFKGDIHLSAEELNRPSTVEKHLGQRVPYWILVAGGKYDYTIKWWHRRRWQKVVDHFRDRLLFVQVGEQGHYHPPLKGVLDLRGKTTLRELIHVIYHADGVVCPVTLHMHLAAAVPLPPQRRRLRGCVVVAGGREPAHWEQYPGHHYLHTIGALDCCATNGCWRARTVPLGDGSPLDAPEALCCNVTPAGLPRCMDLITPEAVCQAVEINLLQIP